MIVERALSLVQPWATLVAIGAKSVETRVWSTNFRGWVAIHASKRFPMEARGIDTLPLLREARAILDKLA